MRNAVRVGGEVVGEILVGRCLERAAASSETELQLLPQAATDDRVVAVEPEREGLAVENLLTHEVLDQAVELLLGRAAAARCA